jgi:hypothetical protein
MKSGDTFLYPLDSSNSEHLWIVVTNPDSDGFILIVNITTVYSDDKDCVDATVCLNPGEHRFVNDRSYVYYRGAMTKKVSDLQAEQKVGRLKMHESCSSALIGLVRAGIGASKHCNKNIKRFYDERKEL